MMCTTAWLVIDNDPFAAGFTLVARGGKTGFFHGIAHAAGNGFGLAIGGAGGHNYALKQRG